MFAKAFQMVQKEFKNIVSNLNPGEQESKIKINDKEYVEDKLIAEGGFGYIYQIHSPGHKEQKYALKRINIADKKHLKQVKNEVNLWSKISKNKHIVQLIDFEITEKVAFIVMEFCEGGTLLDYIIKKDKPISEFEALNIVYQIASGLKFMHSFNPAISHRDIKIENILLKNGNIKICDFGSASTSSFESGNVDQKTKNEHFSNFEKNSTLIYRPPEMCDIYSNYVINEKVDIWALGCILYSVLFKIHPFQEAQKLQIISGQYSLPDTASQYSEKIIDLIRYMLTPDPSQRPSAKEIVDITNKWDNCSINLCQEVQELKQKQLARQGNKKMMTQEDIERIQKKIKAKQGNDGNNGGTWDPFGYENGGLKSNNNGNETGKNLLEFDFVDDNGAGNNNKNQGVDLFDFGTGNSGNVSQPQQSQKPANNLSELGWDFNFQQQNKIEKEEDIFVFNPLENKPPVQEANINKSKTNPVPMSFGNKGSFSGSSNVGGSNNAFNNNTSSNQVFDLFQIDNTKLQNVSLTHNELKTNGKKTSNNNQNQDILSFFQ